MTLANSHLNGLVMAPEDWRICRNINGLKVLTGTDCSIGRWKHLYNLRYVNIKPLFMSCVLVVFSSCNARSCSESKNKIKRLAPVQTTAPSSLFMTPWLSCRILTASRIHLVVWSSRAMIVASFQLMTWFSWLTWSVIADLFCSDCFLERLVYLRLFYDFNV